VCKRTGFHGSLHRSHRQRPVGASQVWPLAQAEAMGNAPHAAVHTVEVAARPSSSWQVSPPWQSALLRHTLQEFGGWQKIFGLYL